MAFYRGQKVVCVDDSHTRHGKRWFPGSEIKRDTVYTVREVGLDVDGCPGLRLREVILNARTNGRIESDLFYMATRFRPVVERKTDIGVFHEILRKVTRRQGADA